MSESPISELPIDCSTKAEHKRLMAEEKTIKSPGDYARSQKVETLDLREPRTILPRKDEWMSRGLCNDGLATMMPLFYSYEEERVEVAKQICKACPVIQQCLEYAIDNKINDGVWGGASEPERRKILQSQRASAANANPSVVNESS